MFLLSVNHWWLTGKTAPAFFWQKPQDSNQQRLDFPGGPVVKTPFFQFRGLGFDPWLGNWDPTCRMARPKKTNNNNYNTTKPNNYPTFKRL